MKIANKTEALACLSLLQQDVEMLRDGEWVPDDDSCNASIEVIEAIKNYLEELK